MIQVACVLKVFAKGSSELKKTNLCRFYTYICSESIYSRDFATLCHYSEESRAEQNSYKVYPEKVLS